MSFSNAARRCAGTLLLAATFASASRAQSTDLTVPSAPVVLKLSTPLSAGDVQQLRAEGIRLLHHYGDGRYLLSAAPKRLSFERSAAPASAKTAYASIVNVYADWAEGTAAVGETPEGTEARASGVSERRPVQLVLAYPGAGAHLGQVLAKADFRADELQFQGGASIAGEVDLAGLQLLLAHPLVLDVSPVAGEMQPYVDFVSWEQRVTTLNSSLPGGYDLNGEGIVIGVGDGGRLGDHPDLAGRVLFSTPYYNAAWGAHPDLVTGTVGGSGIVDPRFVGAANKAKFVIESSSAVTYFSPTLFADYGMTITNNSYGPSFNCATTGRYYGQARDIDQQLFDHRKISHLFASGNSGSHDCGAGGTYGTLVSGGQTAKNTITVGNAQASRTRYRSSSSGPTFDGRLKPEVIAMGMSVTSTNRAAGYDRVSGTSIATPSVAGMLALYTEHYKNLHQDTLPSGALLKAVLCNAAEDVGRPGPDFEHGFGIVNGINGIQTISDGTFVEEELLVGQAYAKTIPVAAGVERLKVMLYWHDRPGPIQNTSATLVDDLDLYLLTPTGDTIRPWVLDALNPASVASRGRDSLNNIEQVTFDSPAAGNYIIMVTSKKQPFGQTDFVLTWSAIAPRVQIVHPVEGQTYDASQGITVAWDASPQQLGDWRVEYADVAAAADGAEGVEASPSLTWLPVNGGTIGHASRSWAWTPPSPHAQYVFRVTNTGTGVSSQTSTPVKTFPTPTDVSTAPVCAGEVQLKWSAVPDAVGYEMFTFDGSALQSLGVVRDTSAVLVDLTPEEETLLSVAAIDAAGAKSPRAVAVMAAPTDGEEACGTALPVVWTGFSAEDRPEAVRLHWSVASEIQTDRFEVQRSVVGEENPVWVSLGEVSARGFSTTAAAYTFDDVDVVAGQTYYYRIKQWDLDGGFEETELIAHTREASGVSGVSEVITLTQNPVGAELLLSYRGAEPSTVELLDMAGRRVATLPIQAGENQITWPMQAPGGWYVLRVSDGDRALSVRLFKG